MDKAAAEVYEQAFVPALFAQYAGPVADAARVGPGARVLDVACGTGVVAREAVRRAGPSGRVVGLDASAGMLAVAAEAAPGIAWRRGRAEELPFAGASFDAVTCAFALMFFGDPLAALLEMERVCVPGGRVALAVWGPLETAPGYAGLVAVLEQVFGARAADVLREPFRMGDRAELAVLCAKAGLVGAEITTRAGTAQFPSLHAWMETDVRGWAPLGAHLDGRRFRALVEAAGRELRAYVGEDGAVAFPVTAHLVSAVR